MSLGACIPGLVADGKLTAEQGQQASALFEELRQDLRRQFGDQAADAMASDATLKALEAQAARKRFLAAQTVRARQRIEADMGRYNGGNGGNGGPIDPRSGPAFLGGDGRAPYSNVEGRWRAVRARAHAMLDKILSDHSANLLGKVRGRAQLTDIVRELFGQDSGNPAARELADAWRRTSEMLRQRFNAAGGDIGKLDDWGLPQSHDARQVRAAGYEAWRAEILPRLDLNRMVDRRTGRPFTGESLELALRDVFETIRSDGWMDRTPGGLGQGALANRRSDPRFFVFKSADDWLAYAEKFGGGNAFDVMMHHVDGMARDIAMMEVLGPNPAATVKWLKDTIMKSAQTDKSPNSRAVDRAKPAQRAIDEMWGELSGENTRPVSRGLALTFSALRSWATSAKLGSALLSATADMAYQRSTRAYNGLRSSTMLRDYVKLFRPGAREDQRMAIRRGLIAEEWAHRTAAQGRYLNQELTGEVSRRLAEGVLRISGLARWTQAGRWAFGMEFLGTLTENRGKAFAALEPPLREAMERYGFTAADWDAIRTAPTKTDRGVEWISPPDLADQRLGDRLMEMIGREADHAVPVPDLRVKAAINSQLKSGTWLGEAGRSALLFKSFGVTTMVMQARRIMEMNAARGRWSAARYVAGLVIGTTIMGGLTMQLKAIANGKDPRDSTTPEFWGAAMLQGGGFGIFGDFLQSQTNSHGGSMAETAAGPIFGDFQLAADVVRKKNHGAAALKFVRAELPGGSLWYGKLALDRLVTDQIREAIDPNYPDAWRTMERHADEQGTSFWWAPGETAPARAPDLENMTGQEDFQP